MSGKRKDMENCCLEELLECYPELKAIRKEIWDAYQCMVKCFETGHKLLIAGNGGSSSDAQHIVGELMKGGRRDAGGDPQAPEQLVPSGAA